MIYKSTRSNIKVDDYTGLINGISKDGGLFLPEHMPSINLNEVLNLSYNELCVKILEMFFQNPKFNLKENIDKAYENFQVENKIDVKDFDGFGFIELFHGPTLAFKDMALEVLPYLLKSALEIENKDKEILILTATSGDTGSAALEGFRSLDKIKILVLYPNVGVSNIQELQMTSIKDKNTKVISIDGNFDDAQKKVKELFVDEEIKNISENTNVFLSSANSINIGRLVPQIVYYIYSYLDLVRKNRIKMGDEINVCVPTGNFGNILASYLAKEMGLPVNKFICASNKNNVLTDFFNTGEYSVNRDFYVTSSPSMDILVSSNLERLLNIKLGEEKTTELMKSLNENKSYKVDKNLFNEFVADFASPEETKEEIQRIYKEHNYLVDPHTSVASNVYKKYVEKTGDKTYTLIAATASPYKFVETMANSLGIEYTNDFETCEKLGELTDMKVPYQIEKLKNETIDKNTVKIEDIKSIVLNFMK